ncbi:MAG: hypothetical protein AAGJ94_16450 [Pseudomonadota bacterium]
MATEFIKLYSERNSGSNWLRSIVDANIDARSFPLTGKERRQIPGQDRMPKEIRKLTRALPPRDPKEFEARKDKINEVRSKWSFGWKHCAPQLETLQESSLFDKTAFIFLVKNPYWFVRSLHTRPYNRLVNNKVTLDKFATQPWPLQGRDGLTGEYVDSPIHLWQEKLRAYLAVMEAVPDKTILIKYEECIVDIEAVLRQIAEKFSVPRLELKVMTADSKSGVERDPNYYINKYLATDYEKYFSAKSLAFMNAALDQDLTGSLGYETAKIPA